MLKYKLYKGGVNISMFNQFLDLEVSVYCVVPYSHFQVVFTGMLSSEDADSITLTSAIDLNLPLRKYKSLVIKKDTIVSIGELNSKLIKA